MNHLQMLVTAYAMLLVSGIVTVSTPCSQGDGPSEEPTQIVGNQVFPPPDMSNESAVRDLGGMLNQTLGLNVSGTPIERGVLYGGSYMDGFNATVEIPAVGWAFQSTSGTVLTLQYASSTKEFIAFDLHLSPPRPMGALDLHDFTVSIADSLGISLAGATYVERSMSYMVEDPNGTGQIELIHKLGIWRETYDSLPLHFVNQLKVWEDNETHSATWMTVFRWFDALPPLNFTADEALGAATKAANRLYGPRPVSSSSVGIMPNYENMTWSFMVDLDFSYPDCRSESVVLLLSMESLEFQSVNSRTIMVCDRGGFQIPSCIFLVLLFAGVFLVAISVAWFGQINSAWAAAFVSMFLPLYLRIKRESVLDHFLRGRIVEFVASNPGATFSQIQQRFNVANGMLNYHLWVLSRTGHVRSEKEGKFTRYYSENTSERAGMILSPFQCSLMSIVSAEGSVVLRELARELDCSKQRAHYNVRRLEKSGLVEISRRDGVPVVSLSQKGAALLRGSGKADAASEDS